AGAEGGEEAGGGEVEGAALAVVPDVEEGIQGEEAAVGGDGVVVQRLVEGQELCPEGRGEEGEEPGPVACGLAVEQSGVEDEEGPERQDVEQDEHRLEVEDIGRPLDRLLGGLSDRLEAVRGGRVLLLDVSWVALLQDDAVERDLGGGPEG